MSECKSECSDFVPPKSEQPTVKKQERSYEEIDALILSVIKSEGSVSAYFFRSHFKIKYETAKNHLDKFVKDGILYTKSVGRYTYYTFTPDRNKIKIQKGQPDKKNGKDHTEGYGRVSVIRGTNPSEIIRQRGFVCHPNCNPEMVSRDFIRCHHNGEYQVKIIKKGQMAEGTHYIPIEHTDQSIVVNWSFSDLTLNCQCLCKIKFPSDKRQFALRTVSTKDNKVKLMSIWVHPRYIFNVGVVQTAHEEFLQQVRDILPILQAEGWEFGNEISYVGDHHYAFNDTSLGGLVQNYERKEGCPIEFDHSHGVNEMEVIGDNNELIECIANLPQLLNGIAVSLKSTTTSLIELGKQVQILAKTQVDALSVAYTQKPFDSKEGNMYG